MKILPILAPNLEKRDDRRRAVKLSIMAKVRMEKLWGMYKFFREKIRKKSMINLAFTAINSIFAKKIGNTAKSS